MTETLYRQTLAFLNKNPRLINFTILNHQTTKDMLETIKNENHLSNVMICRAVYNWDAIYSYLVKYYPENHHVCHIKKLTPNIDITNLESYINGLYITPHGIYNPSTNYLHHIYIFGQLGNTFKLINDEIIQKLHHIVSKIDTTDCENNIFHAQLGSAQPSKKLQNTVINDKLLIRCPDMLVWAIKNNYVSERLFIYKDSITKML